MTTPQQPAGAVPMLELTGVTKSFGNVRAVSDVTFGVERGEVLGLIGPNGAGKTTLVNLISAYLPPTEGVISFQGTDIAGVRAYQMARRGIVRTYQNLRLFEESTALDNVLIGRSNSFTGRLWQLLVRRRREEQRERATARQLMERLDLAAVADERVSELSYGVRRRVEIARALATDPTLLLLDEPTAGMTRAESDEIGRLILELQREGITVLLVDHNVRLVTEVCTRVAVLDWGELIAIDDPTAVWADQRVRDAYLGTKETTT